MKKQKPLTKLWKVSSTMFEEKHADTIIIFEKLLKNKR